MDSLILFNSITINGITQYNYHYAKYDKYDRYGIEVLIHVQLLLAYLPLVCFIVYIILSLTSKAKDRKFKQNLALNIQLKELTISGSDDELPSRLQNSEEMSEYTNETDYELFGKQTDSSYSY